MVRMQSARLAARSLDMQTYIWHADLTGMYLAQQLLESADRGVRVRLLLDDLDARAKNDGLAALAAHPNIEVRMFNPLVTRKGTLSKAGEGAFNFKRINRRMHNKSWIADNRIAVVGGRNVGDEYFGAGDEMNFVDLDFAMLGPIVRDISASLRQVLELALRVPDGNRWIRKASATRRSRSCAKDSPSARPAPRRAAMRSRCAATTSSGGCSRATGRCNGRRSTSSCRTTRARSR